MKLLVVILIFITSVAYGGDSAQLTARLESTVIPELTITTQPLNNALNDILTACAKTQPDGWMPGVILNLNGIPEPIVSLHAENISVLQSLKRVSEPNGLDVTVEGNVVEIKPNK